MVDDSGGHHDGRTERRLPSVRRRRVLQTVAVTATAGSAFSDLAGAEASGPCEPAIPDLTVFNADDRARTATVATEHGSNVRPVGSRTIRLDPGETTTIDSIAPEVTDRRLRVTFDDGTRVDRELTALLTERFRFGLDVTVTADDTHVQTMHVDIPAEEHASLSARCADE